MVDRADLGYHWVDARQEEERLLDCALRGSPSQAAYLRFGSVKDHLGDTSEEEAHGPSDYVLREAVVSEEGVEPVVPEVVQRTGEVQERGRGPTAAMKALDSPQRPAGAHIGPRGYCFTRGLPCPPVGLGHLLCGVPGGTHAAVGRSGRLGRPGCANPSCARPPCR